MPIVKKRCPTCAHGWMDHWGRDECPKCLTPLSRPGARKWGGANINSSLRENFYKWHDAEPPSGFVRQPGESFTPCRAVKAVNAAATGQRKQVPHTSNEDANPTRKECPTCAHKWTDYHGFDQCPKCLNPLSRPGAREWGGSAMIGSSLREHLYVFGGREVKESFTGSKPVPGESSPAPTISPQP